MTHDYLNLVTNPFTQTITCDNCLILLASHFLVSARAGKKEKEEENYGPVSKTIFSDF